MSHSEISFKNLIGTLPDPLHFEKDDGFQSESCNFRDFTSGNFAYWMRKLKVEPRLHSKQWQYFKILQGSSHVATDSSEIRAIGFGVGAEPLPSYFASVDWKVLATDFFESPTAGLWSGTQQMVSAKQGLNVVQICDPTKFEENLALASLDMNEIPRTFNECFDFAWSNCALGHIGNYRRGLAFILSSLEVLKIGGVAVHTTEIDLESTEPPFDNPSLSFYHISDLQEILNIARSRGFFCTEFRLNEATHPAETNYDHEPYCQEPHLRIVAAGRKITPVALMFKRVS